MELTFVEQTNAFLYSLFLGIVLAFVYGLFKFARFAFSFGKAAVFVTDFLFMLIWTFSGFFLSLGYLSGYVRIYVFIGSFLGFLLYRLTLGQLVFRIYKPIIGFLKTLLQKICTKVKLIAKKLLKIACKVLYNIIRYKDNYRNNRKTKSKAHLKKRKKYEVEKTKNQKGRGRLRKSRSRNRRAQGDGKA